MSKQIELDAWSLLPTVPSHLEFIKGTPRVSVLHAQLRGGGSGLL